MIVRPFYYRIPRECGLSFSNCALGSSFSMHLRVLRKTYYSLLCSGRLAREIESLLSPCNMKLARENVQRKGGFIQGDEGWKQCSVSRLTLDFSTHHQILFYRFIHVNTIFLHELERKSMNVTSPVSRRQCVIAVYYRLQFRLYKQLTDSLREDTGLALLDFSAYNKQYSLKSA